MAKDNWNELITQAWSDDSLTDVERVRVIDDLARTRPPRDPLAMFEQGSARDAAGYEEQAIPYYRAALEGGLPQDERGQALIQLASSYRNVGQVQTAVEILEMAAQDPQHTLNAEVDVFLALSYYTAGQPAKAVALLIRRIAPDLQFYERSALSYADELDDTDMPTANTGETAL